jgi:hypothetical protein
MQEKEDARHTFHRGKRLRRGSGGMDWYQRNKGMQLTGFFLCKNPWSVTGKRSIIFCVDPAVMGLKNQKGQKSHSIVGYRPIS